MFCIPDLVWILSNAVIACCTFLGQVASQHFWHNKIASEGFQNRNHRPPQSVSLRCILPQNSHQESLPAMDISQTLDEPTLRRSPRRRSLEKPANSDAVMNEVLSGNRSSRRTFPEAPNRSRSPIRKTPKKPAQDRSRHNLFGAPPLQKEDKSVVVTDKCYAAAPIPSWRYEEDAHAWDTTDAKSNLPDAPMNPPTTTDNSSGAVPSGASRYREDPRAWEPTGPESSLPDPPMPADLALASALFGKSREKKGAIGLFGKPSSPIPHWPPHTSPRNQSTSQSLGLFGQPTVSKSPPISGPFNRSPFQPRTIFGQPSNAPLTRGLFGIPLPRASRRLFLPSFVDFLDEEIGGWNPEYQVSPPSPPPGILNMPYNVSGEEELLDSLDPCYDSDWNERLFNPIPGAGIYLGELKDPNENPKDQNVVYASLGVDGEVEVKARPYNRTGAKLPSCKEGELQFKDIEFRACFGGRWISEGDMEDVKRCAKGRLDRKNELDKRRELRFEEDVRRFWRNKKFNAG